MIVGPGVAGVKRKTARAAASRARRRRLAAGLELGVDDLLELRGVPRAAHPPPVDEEGGRGVDAELLAVLRRIQDRLVVAVGGEAGLEGRAVEAERPRG